MTRWAWVPALVALVVDLWVGVLVFSEVYLLGWKGWVAGLLAVLVPLAGFAGAYLYGVRVGYRAGYVKGGDDMLERVLV